MQLERRLARTTLFEKYSRDFEDFGALCRETGKPLKTLFNDMSAEKYAKDAWTDCAFDEVLARNDLVVRGIGGVPVSFVEKFHRAPGGEELLQEFLRNYYRNLLSIDELELNQASLTQDLEPESPYRSPTDLPVVERRRVRPRLRIADIGGGVDTVTSVDWRRTIYNTPEQAEMPVLRAQGAPIVPDRISLEKTLNTMKQYGGAVEYSRDFATDPIRLDALTTWVMRRAMRDEIMIVREGISLAKSQAGTANQRGAGWDLADILEFTMTGDDGYQFDTILCRVSDARTIVQGYANALGTNNFFPEMPDPRFNASAFPTIGIINNIMGPTRLGFISDDAKDINGNTIFNPGEVLLIDSTVLRFKRRAAGFVDEEEYVMNSQMHCRYITDWFDWEITDAGGLDLQSLT